jgi:hypothetical protein
MDTMGDKDGLDDGGGGQSGRKGPDEMRWRRGAAAAASGCDGGRGLWRLAAADGTQIRLDRAKVPCQSP